MLAICLFFLSLQSDVLQAFSSPAAPLDAEEQQQKLAKSICASQEQREELERVCGYIALHWQEWMTKGTSEKRFFSFLGERLSPNSSIVVHRDADDVSILLRGHLKRLGFGGSKQVDRVLSYRLGEEVALVYPRAVATRWLSELKEGMEQILPAVGRSKTTHRGAIELHGQETIVLSCEEADHHSPQPFYSTLPKVVCRAIQQARRENRREPLEEERLWREEEIRRRNERRRATSVALKAKQEPQQRVARAARRDPLRERSTTGKRERPAALVSDRLMRDHYCQEVELLMKLQKLPGIVELHAASYCLDEQGATLYPLTIAKLYRGGTLWHWCNDRSIAPPTAEERWLVASSLLQAMVTLDKEAIVHGDMNSNNILIDREETSGRTLGAVLCDFGLARHEEVNQSHRESQQIMTIISEQVLGRKHPCHKPLLELWSLARAEKWSLEEFCSQCFQQLAPLAQEPSSQPNLSQSGVIVRTSSSSLARA